ncbi:MAG: hypothetical protein KF729_06435 [Sandaracinaceae bacterium]|nr:hypothetical protein [Sandaracinaceae bacterium]
MRSRSHGLRAALPLIALAACGPPRYEAPSLTEPHATVTVRVIHHDISGRDLQHQTLLDGHEISLGERVAAVRGAPLTRSVRVRPRPDRWEFRSVFSHTEVRMETVMENEQYNCGTQTVGFGASARTQPRTCTRSVPRTRSVTRRVVDGECRAIAPFSPRVDGHYVMQFDYHGPGSCRARCFEQTPQADGGFALRPC